ncbi:MAG: M20/M25/M40 family metallo-hydrolase [Anaerolineae bacterium]|nr:M20/M25/M40 family metallo-hydrolase [Anaerolineae bacterium]
MSQLYEKPLELLQTLIRYDTTNPPGNEGEIVHYLQNLLKDSGLETTILAKADNRPNLIARLPGQGMAPPLLLQAHTDVVTTANQQWTHPPFAAEIKDGFLWGRGTLDDKCGIAMMVAAVLRAKAENTPLPGDILLTLVCDEEVDGAYGAKFLVENHPEQFTGVKYCLGEGGGPTVTIGGKKFYTIMVAEKQACPLRLTIHGPAGHGSMPFYGEGAMHELSRVLNILTTKRLPVHVTPVAKQMLTTIGDNLPFPTGWALRQMTNPTMTDRMLALSGSASRLLDPLLHNSVSPTIVNGGHKINVIPSEISLDLDGRLLPGFHPTDMLRELRHLLGSHIGLEITRYDPGKSDVDMQWYDTLADILRDADPEGIPVPTMLSGVTDGRFFAKLGIQTYGFQPMHLPTGLIDTIHAADERIPVEAMDFAANAIFQAIQRIGAN